MNKRIRLKMRELINRIDALEKSENKWAVLELKAAARKLKLLRKQGMSRPRSVRSSVRLLQVGHQSDRGATGWQLKNQWFMKKMNRQFVKRDSQWHSPSP